VLCAQSGNTPLHNAAQSGHASVVTLLLERRADKDAKDKVRTRHAHAPARSTYMCAA
jgi:ankyrin repeat protein